MDKKCGQLSVEAAEKSFLNKENNSLGKGRRKKIPKTQFELPDEQVPKVCITNSVHSLYNCLFINLLIFLSYIIITQKSKTSTYNILKIKESLVNAAQSKDTNKCDSCDTLKQEMSEIIEERDNLQKKADRYKRNMH